MLVLAAEFACSSVRTSRRPAVRSLVVRGSSAGDSDSRKLKQGVAGLDVVAVAGHHPHDRGRLGQAVAAVGDAVEGLRVLESMLRPHQAREDYLAIVASGRLWSWNESIIGLLCCASIDVDGLRGR